VDEGKLSLESKDIAAEKRQELLRLFPEAQTEGGRIDFDQLKRALGDAVDSGRERYGMNWPGKADCFRLIQSPSTATLLPVRAESVRFDETENMIIEGDNLEVLKLLQKGYQDKVKMIYIDPPYNTGNDFIYPDDFADNLRNYLQYTGQVDAEEKRFSNNLETDGRFHSKWLNMMYPRLYLARNLLREDGVIFVSIDDHEIATTRLLMDEVFGQKNFCATFVWNTEGNTDNQYTVKVNHEYIVAYFKSSLHADAAIGRVVDPNTREDSNLWKGIADNNINKNNPENPPDVVTLPVGFPSSEEELFYGKKIVDERFFSVSRQEKYISDELKNEYGIEKLSGLPVKLDDLTVENHTLMKPCRIYGGFANRNKLLEFIKNECQPVIDEGGTPIRFYLNANAAVRYQKVNEKPRNVLSVLRNVGTTEKSRTYLKTLEVFYDYPKPLGLIEYLVKIGCEDPNGIVLDFFAGSGTTGEAVLRLNISESTRRQFICVQLPEKLTDTRFGNLTQIARHRLKSVCGQQDSPTPRIPGIDIHPPSGFRALRLAESNFKIWDAHTEDGVQGVERQMELAVNHIVSDRTSGDLFYEILMKSEYPLTAKIENFDAAGIAAVSVEDDALIVCVERKVTSEAVAAIANRSPSKVIFLDEAFSGNDQLKANAKMNFESAGVKRFETV
jgi:adenine-specific DNA-methyltransferase